MKIAPPFKMSTLAFVGLPLNNLAKMTKDFPYLKYSHKRCVEISVPPFFCNNNNSKKKGKRVGKERVHKLFN
jgi:hypothetical protein